MDRAEAVQRLLKVFRQHGYEGATLSRISEATGLGRASLYHHFPNGKKEMAEAVLNYVNQWFKATVLEPLYSEGQPVERIQAMNTSLSQFYNCGRDACLLAVFTLGDSNDLFRPQVQQALNAWIDGLTQVLTEAELDEVQAGSVVSRRSTLDSEQARKRAEDAVMQIQGALVLTRALGDTALFERVLQQLPVKLMDVVCEHG